jgi:hypothetical protein
MEKIILPTGETVEIFETEEEKSNGNNIAVDPNNS